MSKELCLEFMRDINLREVDRMAAWFTPESVLWMPPGPPIHGNRRIAAMFRIIFRNYTEIKWTVTEVHQLAERRFMYLSDSCGIIGENTPFKNHLCTILQFDENGKISNLSDYFKDTAIFGVAKESKIRAAPTPPPHDAIA